MTEKEMNVNNQKPVLLACSGGSNVGEIADLAARKLFRDGSVVMTCPTAISGRIESQLNRMKQETKVIVLDGCDIDCVGKTLRLAGFDGFIHIRLNELDLFKGAAKVDDATVDKVVQHVKNIIKTSSLWQTRKGFVFNFDPAKVDQDINKK